MDIFEKDLTKLSTIRVKSHAKYFCEPQNINDIQEAIEFKISHNLKHVILGNGSNILFSKENYEDVLFIKLSGEFNFFKINKDAIDIGAAYPLKLAGKQLIKNGYSDYIFFNLIPACIGGAITQNAGVGNGSEIKDVCISATLFDISNNKVVELANKECLFEYRNSIIKKEKNQFIVLYSKFSISNRTSDVDSLISLSRDRIQEKVDREPSGYSFGSTFMNSKLPAWQCIKNIKNKLDVINGVCYSEKHKNWIVNHGNSRGADIVSLIENTQKLVKEELDIDLVNEVRII